MDAPLEIAQAPAPALPLEGAAPSPAPGGAPASQAGAPVPYRQVPGPDPAADPSWMFMMPVVFIAIFYFIVFRPQQRKERERREQIEKLKKNDRVLTSGGVYGTVHSVKDNVVVLKVDEDTDTKLRVAKNAITLVENAVEEGKK